MLKSLNPTSRPRVDRRRQACLSTRLTIVCKQYVPSDSFGGISPERKAANSLRSFFTFVAARVVLAQLEGSGRGALGAYNQQAYNDLSTFVQNEPLKDCDQWLSKLMRKNSMLAVRVMEVREAYANEDFEWDNCRKLAVEDIKQGNLQLMRESAKASLAASLSGASAEHPEQPQQEPGPAKDA